jgi:hypothetical protein
MSTLVQLPTEPASSQRTLQPASTAHNCPSCGTSVSFDTEGLEEARKTIRDLEAQMDLLKEKAATAGKTVESTNRNMCSREAYTVYSEQMRRL